MPFGPAPPLDVPHQVESLLRAGRMEEALDALRRLGFPFLQAIRAVRQVTGLPLDECKRLVHLSAVWRDSRADRDEFYAELEAAVADIVEGLEDGQEPSGRRVEPDGP
jgi:hypothetical protein